MKFKADSKAQQLRKEGLSKLRYVLQEIKAKRLNYKQGTWHCGTAHCVFGWIDMFEGTKSMPLEEIISLDFNNFTQHYFSYEEALKINGYIFHLNENIVESWQNKYKISKDDYTVEGLLERIYDGHAKLEDQFRALGELEIYYFGKKQIVTENPFDITTQQQKNFQELDEDDEDYEDYDWYESDVPYHSNSPLAVAESELRQFANAFESIFKEAFGSDSLVICTKEGFEVREYEHD